MEIGLTYSFSIQVHELIVHKFTAICTLQNQSGCVIPTKVMIVFVKIA